MKVDVTNLPPAAGFSVSAGRKLLDWLTGGRLAESFVAQGAGGISEEARVGTASPAASAETSNDPSLIGRRLAAYTPAAEAAGSVPVVTPIGSVNPSGTAAWGGRRRGLI